MERKGSLYIKLGIALVMVLLVAAGNRYIGNGAIRNFIIKNISYPFTVWRQQKSVSNDEAVQVFSEALERENNLLRSQLGVQTRSSPDLVIAKITAVHRTALVSLIRINRGTAEGIQKGMTVISGGNVLVGTIIEVGEHSAEVLLPDDPRSAISVRIHDTDILAESRGNLSGMVDLNLISQTEIISPDSLILTSGLDHFPEALIIGRITSVERGESQLFKKVEGRISFTVLGGPLVFIIK